MSEYEEGNHVEVRERSSRFYKRAVARVCGVRRQAIALHIFRLTANA